MYLSVVSVGFVAALFGIAAALWFTVVWLRRNRSWRRVAVVGAVVVTLAGIADTVNWHFEYWPHLGDVLGLAQWPTATRAQVDRVLEPPTQTSPGSTSSSAAPVSAAPSSSTTKVSTSPTLAHGAVVTVDVPASGVGLPSRQAYVYLPPQYFSQPTQRFPTVYLLHGSPGIPTDWLRGGQAAQAALHQAQAGRPVILVIPRVSRRWLDDSECVDGAATRVETYVTKELVPAIDEELRTIATPAGRTIGGMSAGGYCALNLGLRHRDQFGAIIDMSGLTHPTHTGGMRALFGKYADAAQLAAANSPDVYARSLVPSPPTRVFMLTGTSDGEVLREMTSMRETLRRQGFPVTWQTVPGAHTFAVWRPGLERALTWDLASGSG